MKSRTQLVLELKETLDLRTREAEVNRHMDSIVPAIQQALEQTQPVFHQGTVEYVGSLPPRCHPHRR